MNIERKHSLSFKLLRWVLSAALLVGFAFSLTQIAYDAFITRHLIESDAERILAMFKDPSTQALYSLDQNMGQQVVVGLLKHEAVRSAMIGNDGEPVLAQGSRELRKLFGRNLTDMVFSQERAYQIPLVSSTNPDEHYGDLRIVLDTAVYGERLLTNAVVILASGILRALVLGLVLYLIYHALLTRPLAKIIRHLGRINPDRPGEYQLPVLSGHEDNELGVWTRNVNQLLASIERNTDLRREAEDSLLLMSQIDFLTGLPNRQELQLQLDKIIDDARDKQQGVAVLCLGLDDFKNINEQHNYQIGDWLLQGLAQRLRIHTGLDGCLARLGGDQFVIVLSGIKDPEQAAALAQNILDSLKEPLVMAQSFGPEFLSVRLNATIGITLYPDDGDNTELLLQQAEQTMQLAKRGARNRYQFFIASIDLEMRKRRRLKKELKDAIINNQLYLVYQPQINYYTKKIIGVEALLRWNHPELGLIPPDVFIPLAEQSSNIIEIGEWVLDQACQQLRSWIDDGMHDFRMAVNLSATQLHHADLLRQVKEKLAMYDLHPSSLELEVTETGLMEDIKAAAKNLRGLRDIGVLVAIDDFGTGYSSLSYLKTLSLDKIKIDKSFVQDMLDSEDNAIIVKTIIQLSKSLGMQVIAEGVETLEQERFIIELGCDEGQGYLYGKPSMASQVRLLVNNA
ncbi:MAG: EAL domain-containing protein [Pseudomonas sp.]|nr:EAL domain-containing protein [Pseudomonas sp.]